MEVKLIPNKGRGVVAKRVYFEGEIVMISELLVLSCEDTMKVQSTALRNYTYLFDGDTDCIALGLASLLNHSDESNLRYFALKSTAQLIFVAVKTIVTGEEMTIDYSADVKVDLAEVMAAKSLMK